MKKTNKDRMNPINRGLHIFKYFIYDFRDSILFLITNTQQNLIVLTCLFVILSVLRSSLREQFLDFLHINKSKIMIELGLGVLNHIYCVDCEHEPHCTAVNILIAGCKYRT